jgi:hypothetical protein
MEIKEILRETVEWFYWDGEKDFNNHSDYYKEFSSKIKALIEQEKAKAVKEAIERHLETKWDKKYEEALMVLSWNNYKESKMDNIEETFKKLKEFYPKGSVFLVLEQKQADSIVNQAISDYQQSLLEWARENTDTAHPDGNILYLDDLENYIKER